jgi:energy-coupling factor transport system permease protein
VEAQKMRGNDVTKGGLMKRIGAYAPLIIPLVINGIRKAETLVLALESKGFSPSKKPDMKGRYSLKPSDLAAGAAIFFAAAAAAALKIYGIKI